MKFSRKNAGKKVSTLKQSKDPVGFEPATNERIFKVGVQNISIDETSPSGTCRS